MTWRLEIIDIIAELRELMGDSADDLMWANGTLLPASDHRWCLIISSEKHDATAKITFGQGTALTVDDVTIALKDTEERWERLASIGKEKK